MEVTAPHAPIGRFFSDKARYIIPKYQRGYAWDKSETADFIKDLETCFNARHGGAQGMNHFFGSIVCVRKSVPGTIRQLEYEMVDGQQRLATFVMLVSSMIKVYEGVLEEASAAGDSVESIIEERIRVWKERFVEFTEEVNLEVTSLDVLVMSRADKHFFKETITDGEPEPTRDSHFKIKDAHDAILNKVQSMVGQGTIVQRLSRLEQIQVVIDNDFTILRIETQNKDNAYRLFQVLNDRGKSLTEGDLLRAKTLEIVETHTTVQARVESAWDEVLEDSPSRTKNFLNWTYSSYSGNRAGSNSLFDDFLTHFFPQHSATPLNGTQAAAVKSTIIGLENDVKVLRKIQDGTWPYRHQNPITGWHRDRLYLLSRELRHDLCMPLLLAAKKLDHRKFAEVVQVTERFMFRYIAVCNQHPSRLAGVYHNQCLAIRADPDNYNVSQLRTALAPLISGYANDAVFTTSLKEIRYKVGGGNKVLKYLLMSVEYYLEWYNSGANGEPECVDKSRVYVFSDTTIEHLYPRNAPAADTDAALEPHKNSLGNLTILSADENGDGENDDFMTKRSLYENSTVLLNREIASENPTGWDMTSINNHRDKVIAVALKVFTV